MPKTATKITASISKRKQLSVSLILHLFFFLIRVLLTSQLWFGFISFHFLSLPSGRGANV